MPTILIIAGPNGAGKTTFANRWFAEHGIHCPYLNADEIGRDQLPHLSGAERDVAAGRLLLARLDQLIDAGADFGIETTLSSRLYARRIPEWKAKGYRVELIYIRLRAAEASIQRVAHRVSRGGHGVPLEDLMRRFDRSLANLEIYKPLVDSWDLWESHEGEVILIGGSPS